MTGRVRPHDHQAESSDSSGHPILPHVRLSLLDGFQLWSGGAAVATPLGVQKVLAFLALQRRGANRRHMAGVLWPETTEEQAAANLRSALWRVRRSGLQLTESTRTELRLASSVALDIREMLEAVERIRGGGPGLAGLDVDLTTLSGDLLPGWYDDWVVIERERLGQIRLHALETLSRRLTEARLFDRAILAALAAVASEPLRESANRTLIEAYLAEGNAAEAIRGYRRYGSLLKHELGVRPSFRLSDLTSGDPLRMT